MEDFNFDVIKILGYGAAGLSFLLMFLAYNLIQKEQKIKKPRREILNIVYVYMLFTLLNIVVVGFVGIPAMQDNAVLKQINDTLKVENYKVTSLFKIQKNNDIISDNLTNLSNDSLVSLITQNAEQLDTLAKSATQADEKQKLISLKNDLTKKIDSLARLPAGNKRDMRKILRDIKGYKTQLDKMVDK
jgi:predicted PurR-regulated permease PerM